jgi:hypothetical protein
MLAVIGWMVVIEILGYLGLVLILRSDRKPWEQYTGYATFVVLTTWLMSFTLTQFLLE